jgi:hypothetical protein
MPAGRWLYIFILLFPTFLPERAKEDRNQQKSAAGDELLLVPVDQELSGSLSRAADMSSFASLPLLHQRRDIQVHCGHQASVEIPASIKIETSI